MKINTILEFEDYLSYCITHLQPGDAWQVKSGNIVFILPKIGIGKYISSTGCGHFVPGDVLVYYADGNSQILAESFNGLSFGAFFVSEEHLSALFPTKELGLLKKFTSFLAQNHKLYPAAGEVSGEIHEIASRAVAMNGFVQRGQLLSVVAYVLAHEIHTPHDRYLVEEEPGSPLAHNVEKLAAEEIMTLSVTELAGRCKCSTRQLNRYFQQRFGLSARDLRMEMRLLKAISLLRDPQCKVFTVAEQCKFNHLGLFNSCFKKRFGVSPGQWRKNMVPKEPISTASPAGKIEDSQDSANHGSWQRRFVKEHTEARGRMELAHAS